MGKDVKAYKCSHNRYLYRFICAVVMVGVALFTFAFVWCNYVSVNNMTGRLTGVGNLFMACSIYAILFSIFGCFLHAFKIGVERKSKLVASAIITVFITDFCEVLISSAILGSLKLMLGFVWRYLLLAIVQSSLIALFASLMVDLYRVIVPPIQLLMITGARKQHLDLKVDRIFEKYHIAKEISGNLPEEKIFEEIDKHQAVLLNDLSSELESHIIKKCFDVNKRVYFVPKISDILIKSAESLNVMDTPLFLCRNLGISWWNRLIKRGFDIISSLTALIILSPVMIITAIAIKREDGGPVFFKQERVTQGGKRFQILKFRSMIVDAEKDGRPHPAGEKDDRITKVGHVIRGCRIDELPQLINILKGEMSVVGPRPERWEHVELYKKEIPEFAFREKVKGGLTGFAQVYGKYNTDAIDKIKLDMIYITNYSIFLDLQIIFETVKILFQKESTEGFTVEKVKEIQSNRQPS